jgi:MFS family permease
LVYDLTKTPFYLGLDLFLGQLPIILFSLVGGVFADRLDRRKMLLGSQYIQMICAFARIQQT